VGELCVDLIAAVAHRADRSDNSSSGWSAIHGQTYGAYYAELDPSGSSSGSGVAADLALAVATIGTETDGSIISPAQFNAVVGLKPSVGLTSRFNVIPLSSSQVRLAAAAPL